MYLYFVLRMPFGSCLLLLLLLLLLLITVEPLNKGQIGAWTIRRLSFMGGGVIKKAFNSVLYR